MQPSDLILPPLSARQVIDLLELQPHPEGGHYRETFRDTVTVASGASASNRAASTAIYYLIESGQTTRWHRVDAAEIWHVYAGAPLTLQTAATSQMITDTVLGLDLAAGQRPQGIVPAGVWQRATSLGTWTLAGCTVAPGFEFAGFEMIDGDTPPPDLR